MNTREKFRIRQTPRWYVVQRKYLFIWADYKEYHVPSGHEVYKRVITYSSLYNATKAIDRFCQPKVYHKGRRIIPTHAGKFIAKYKISGSDRLYIIMDSELLVRAQIDYNEQAKSANKTIQYYDSRGEKRD